MARATAYPGPVSATVRATAYPGPVSATVRMTAYQERASVMVRATAYLVVADGIAAALLQPQPQATEVVVVAAGKRVDRARSSFNVVGLNA